MFIDTHTKSGMYSAVCTCFQLNSTELQEKLEDLISYYDYVNHDYDKYIANIDDFIQNEVKELPEEILFFHLTRRLIGAENDSTGYNLVQLLTTQNSFSDFLKEFEIVFKKGSQHIDTIYKGELVDWDKCVCANQANRSYMKKRLGFITGYEDYCFNGLAFQDRILKNDYTRNLFFSPEFLMNLGECLDCKSMAKTYFANSRYFCYEYRLPMHDVIFDNYSECTNEQKPYYFIRCVLERLIDYQVSFHREMFDDDNPILRLSDESNMPSQYYIDRKVITHDILFVNKRSPH